MEVKNIKRYIWKYIDIRFKQKAGNKNSSGFTLIEVVISMAIFGFLAILLTSILLNIVTTITDINERNYLRSSLSTIETTIDKSIQYAYNPISCSTNYTCVEFTSSSLSSTSGNSTMTTSTITFQYVVINNNGYIEETVVVNGNGSGLTTLLNQSNVNISSVNFQLQSGQLITLLTGNDKNIHMGLSSIVQYSR